VDFGVLGPVEAWHEGRRLPSGSGRERFVLASLLLNAGRLMPASDLIGLLWAEPPASAKAQLHNLVSSLRRRYREADPQLIQTRPTGYELRLGSHRLDLAEFRRLVARGRQASGAADHRAASAAYGEALALWRGAALADVPDELVAGVREALHEERLAAVEASFDPELALGRYDEVLRAVGDLLADHPYRERLYQRQMLALVGAGRRADALAAYRRAYRRFVDDLGVEPGPALRELEQRILHGRPLTAPGRPVPRQLPATTAPLTGRDGLLAEVRAELARTGEAAPPVVVLVGPGGIGKTTVALAAARGVLDAYPDGHLYADLRGTHDSPADPHAVLGRFLRALGVAGADVPEDPDERTATYRTLLAARRALVVLDDAADESQVRPLLPGAAACGVLVTSRRQLLGLLGVVRRTVPVLAPEHATLLLSRIIGAERTGAEPDAAAGIVADCGRLPLALCIAAARLSARTGWSLADFRRLLAEQRGRLDELAVGDLDVRASIELSYRGLERPLRTLFRRLGLVSAPDWPAWVARVLAGPDQPVDRQLDQLADMHLVEPAGIDVAGQRRYRMHDLVAEFAADRGLDEDAAADRDAVLTRLLDGWLALASVADEGLALSSPVTAGLPVREPLPDAAPVARAAPADWFESERPALLAAVEQACRHGAADLAGALALRIAAFLATRAYDDDRAAALRAALAAVRKDGTDGMRTRLLGALFSAYAQQDRLDEMPAVVAEQLDVARRTGDRTGEVRALMQAGMLARRQGRLAEADRYLAEAYARRDGMPVQVITTMLATRASIHLEAGRPDAALPLAAEALRLQRGERSPRMVGMRAATYAGALFDTGDLDAAERAYTEAGELLCKTDTDLAAGMLDTRLAEIDLLRADPESAERRLDHAMSVYESHHDTGGRADVLRCRGDLAVVRDRPADAVVPLKESLALFRRLGQPLDAARVLARLDRVLARTGDAATATRYREQCRTILTTLDLDAPSLRLPPFLR
jgi:DNA-binding SARP family transcriptional activator